MEYINDYITGKEIPLTGSEENRQAVEKFLVQEKGFSKNDIEVDSGFDFESGGEVFKARIDLLIKINGIFAAALKTPAGSISSWEKEIVAGARIFNTSYQIPFSIVSDGKNAEIFDTVTGKRINTGIENIPSKKDLEAFLEENESVEFPSDRLERQKMIFKTYITMNVNR